MADKYIFQLRRGWKDDTNGVNDWAAYETEPNHIKPLEGELTLEYDNGIPRLKIGDGINEFGDLEYMSIDSFILSEAAPKTVTVTLLAANWVETVDKDGNIIEDSWCQVVLQNSEDITACSKVDLQPSTNQLAIFHEKDLTFVAENEGGIVTVCCVGQRPQNDYTIQATVTECDAASKIIGNTTATPNPQPDWNQTDPLKADYIKNKPTSIGGGASTTHYEGILGIDGDAVDDIFQSKVPGGGYVTGDTFTIKELISGDKYSYTAYVYDGSVWKAMDGNYNAENVYFDENILITTNAGYIEISNGSGVIPAAGKNLKQVFESIWTQENNPSVTLPAVTIDTAVQYKEVGTTITPSYEASLSSGSYSYGPDTGITAQTWSVVFGDETKTTASGSFSSIVITEGNCCNVTATATYNDGAIPVTNLGNDCASEQIKAGSASASKNLIVGYKPNFYGFKTASIDIGAMDSDTVRGLATNQGKTTTPVSSVESKTSWMQFFYAVPKGRKASLSAKDSNNLPLTVQSKDVTVNHVGGVSSTYTVFYIDNDAAYGPTTLTLTWK